MSGNQRPRGSVRPIGPTDQQPPRFGAALAAAALVTLAVGTVALVLASRPDNPGDRRESATEEAVETTTTTSTTTPALSLGEQVRGFQGALRATFVGESGSPHPWTWGAERLSPLLLDFPNGTETLSWDPAASLLAAIVRPDTGPGTLHLGPPTTIRGAFDAVASYVWHDTEPERLAFLTEPRPDGFTELWRTVPTVLSQASGAFTAFRVARLPFEARLAGYGSWGFALVDTNPTEERVDQLITLDPDGALVAQASLRLLDTGAGGRLLGAINPAGTAYILMITDPSLANPELVGTTGGPEGLLSPNGKWVAGVITTSGRAVLEVFPTAEVETLDLLATGGQPSIRIPIGTAWASPAAWSRNGRWILLTQTQQRAGGPATALYFVDLLDESVYVVPVDGLILDPVVDADGVGAAAFGLTSGSS